MKSYYRIMLGRSSAHAQECFEGNFIGVDFRINEDLTNKFPDQWRDFNKAYIPVFLKSFPDKTKIAAGLACGALWTVGREIQLGDIVLCPDGKGQYYAGEVTGDYKYQPGGNLPHRRPVQWLKKTINRADMGEVLKAATGGPGTKSNISSYGEEIEKLIGGEKIAKLFSTDETIEDPVAFAMEKHLEDFLVKNWSQTNLANEFDIYEEDGEMAGQQYETDTGPLDILAVSKDKKTILVIELKKGRASDVVVGQILRYMGYVQDELAENWQSVKGVIIALEDDQRIRRALSITPSVEFYRYQVSFKLVKA